MKPYRIRTGCVRRVWYNLLVTNHPPGAPMAHGIAGEAPTMSDRACTKCGVTDAYSARNGLCFIHRIREYQLLALEHGEAAVVAEAIRAGSGNTNHDRDETNVNVNETVETIDDTPPAPSTGAGSEAAAHALLRMIGEHPGVMGRLRAARIVGGYAVPYRDEDEQNDLAQYVVQLDWPLREITRLVDALITGRLLAQTPGPRPVLVLTRAGHRTLDALEGSTTVKLEVSA